MKPGFASCLGVSKWFSAALYAFPVYSVSLKHPIKAVVMGLLLEASEAASGGSGSSRRNRTPANSSVGISDECVEETLSSRDGNEPENSSTHSDSADDADAMLHDLITEQVQASFTLTNTRSSTGVDRALQLSQQSLLRRAMTVADINTWVSRQLSTEEKGSKSRKAANPGADTEESAHSSSSHA